MRFNLFRREYNEERPHEALGQTTPASCWTPPRRGLPIKIDEPWYDPDHEVRRVRHDGTIRWRGETVFVGEALARETVGLVAVEARLRHDEHDAGCHVVRFMSRDLGLLDAAGRFRRFAPPDTGFHGVGVLRIENDVRLMLHETVWNAERPVMVFTGDCPTGKAIRLQSAAAVQQSLRRNASPLWPL